MYMDALSQSAGQRPLTVVCLRHRGSYANRGEAWRAISGYLFERGLCGPRTRAVGVLYDDPTASPSDRVRYDVCLSVEPAKWAELDLADAETEQLGIRLDVILGGLRLYQLDSAAEGDGDAAAVAPWLTHRPIRWPVFEFYTRSPAFLSGDAMPCGYYYAPGEFGVDR